MRRLIPLVMLVLLGCSQDIPYAAYAVDDLVSLDRAAASPPAMFDREVVPLLIANVPTCDDCHSVLDEPVGLPEYRLIEHQRHVTTAPGGARTPSRMPYAGVGTKTSAYVAPQRRSPSTRSSICSCATSSTTMTGLRAAVMREPVPLRI